MIKIYNTANFNTMLKVQFSFGLGSQICLAINS